MDRIIEIRINGSHLWKDNRLAGVQGEGNVNYLRITFDESWDGFAKKVTFWDAKGNNPVERTLTADLLEDITVSTLTYLCPIPPEPMAEAGMMTFVIDGWVDGKRARSVGAEMEVEYAPMADNAGEPIDPTPTQAEQIQKQIDTILGDMQERAVRAENAADAAEVSEANAKQSETVAQNAAAVAEGAREEVVAASAAAVAAAESAKAVEDKVLPAAEQAVQAAASAKASENIAVASAESAGASAEAAATHEVGARAASAGVDTAKNEAVASAVAAAKSEAAAKAAQAAAEKARDEATATVGGDFASTAYVDNKAEEAEGNANRYTDQKFSSIPTPDVSGQIGAHNTSTTAHEDIRQALDGKVPFVDACSADYDMDAIMRTKSKGLYMTDGSTLGTPKQYGKTAYASALILTYTDGSYGIQVAYSAGQFVFTRKLDNDVLGEWCSVYTEDNKPLSMETVKNLTQEKAGFATLLEYMASRYNEHVVVYANVSDFSDMPEGVTGGQALINTMDGILTVTLFTRTKVYYRATNSLTSWTQGWEELAYGSHTHTPADIGAAAEGHNQAATTITAGTFAGQVVANSSGQNYSTSLLRNSKLVTADTNPSVNGEICWTYE